MLKQLLYHCCPLGILVCLGSYSKIFVKHINCTFYTFPLSDLILVCTYNVSPVEILYILAVLILNLILKFNVSVTILWCRGYYFHPTV